MMSLIGTAACLLWPQARQNGRGAARYRSTAQAVGRLREPVAFPGADCGPATSPSSGAAPRVLTSWGRENLRASATVASTAATSTAAGNSMWKWNPSPAIVPQLPPLASTRRARRARRAGGSYPARPGAPLGTGRERCEPEPRSQSPGPPLGIASWELRPGTPAPSSGPRLDRAHCIAASPVAVDRGLRPVDARQCRRACR